MTPAGVVLDLGNVLIDWQPALAIAAGVGSVEAEKFLTADDFDFMAWNHEQDSGRSWADGVDEVRRSHPHWLPHARAYLDHFPASLSEVPGSLEVVRDLHGAGIRLVGLTNWSDELYYPHAAPHFEVLRLLDDVVVSGEVKAAKPDPRAYEIAADRAGLPFDRLAFVDDKQLNVDAAAALGMDGILFTGAAELRTELRSRSLPI
ncbi:HAD family hydrolase [Nocardioides mangrovi]|uniref:HAD family phosphatase n=1 Tax=Nocardioides mangrovi TaxID=2874580 RepID=A0ABS7UFB1_9ACTN|nr:HAD family phosphatase [Nocardioides mangrovi]MBZ5739689.1 HAD family phosphatase [Nocardioides mangrovi]